MQHSDTEWYSKRHLTKSNCT